VTQQQRQTFHNQSLSPHINRSPNCYSTKLKNTQHSKFWRGSE